MSLPGCKYSRRFTECYTDSTSSTKSQLLKLQSLSPKILYTLTDWSCDISGIPNIDSDVKRFRLQTDFCVLNLKEHILSCHVHISSNNLYTQFKSAMCRHHSGIFELNASHHKVLTRMTSNLSTLSKTKWLASHMEGIARVQSGK